MRQVFKSVEDILSYLSDNAVEKTIDLVINNIFLISTDLTMMFKYDSTKSIEMSENDVIKIKMYYSKSTYLIISISRLFNSVVKIEYHQLGMVDTLINDELKNRLQELSDTEKVAIAFFKEVLNDDIE